MEDCGNRLETQNLRSVRTSNFEMQLRVDNYTNVKEWRIRKLCSDPNGA